MKLANYIHAGRKSYGIYTDAGIIDLESRIGNIYPTLKDFLAASFISIAQQYSRAPVDLRKVRTSP